MFNVTPEYIHPLAMEGFLNTLAQCEISGGRVAACFTDSRAREFTVTGLVERTGLHDVTVGGKTFSYRYILWVVPTV